MDDYDNALRIAEARAKIQDFITPIRDYQSLALRDCLGRVAAEDTHSPIDVPNHLNSAMDGYALRGADLPTDAKKEFVVTGTAFAGQAYNHNCEPGEAIRIMTGAAMPPGTDTVVMQEKTERLDEQRILIGSGHKTGQHTRRAGEDIARGSIVVRAGHRLSAADLGVLASLGIGELRVRRRPRVVFFSTGDELRSIGDELGPGEVYDSNRYSLYGMLKELDVEIHDLGVVRDDPTALREAFRSAMALGDVVLTSGGVSVGEADHIKGIVAELGSIDFWKIAIKPGRPLAFGKLEGKLGEKTVFFGLPGNPVAVMVTFQQFVTPALHYLASGETYQPLVVDAIAACDLRKMPGRFEFQRGILAYDQRGTLTVTSTGHQGSGILSSMSHANCFILLDEDSGKVKAGDSVKVQPFSHCSLHGLR
jgi:molybdopterin molybdotransferase